MLKGWARSFKLKNIDEDPIIKLKNEDYQDYMELLRLLAEDSIKVGETLGIIGQNLTIVGPVINIDSSESEPEA